MKRASERLLGPASYQILQALVGSEDGRTPRQLASELGYGLVWMRRRLADLRADGLLRNDVAAGPSGRQEAFFRMTALGERRLRYTRRFYCGDC